MSARRFSFARWVAILLKEFIQLKRDRLTFGMIIGIPIIQLTLFGFAINTDPKHLPLMVRDLDPSPYSRSVVTALVNSEYFQLVGSLDSDAAIDEAMERGDAQFVLTIPAGFAHSLLRGEKPALLLEADASDPAAAGAALAALAGINTQTIAPDLPGKVAAADPNLFEWRVQRRYNPEGITAYNIVPGLMGVILTMTMILMTGLAMTRERERGTFENLLATPALPIEVMTGKIIPYVIIGLIQVTLILVAAHWIFHVPMVGNIALLYAGVLLFITANLTLGITFSSIARNQLQAMQMTFFFFLPSILLSGFMFPFRGMPGWAQTIGSALPLTHFLRLARGILLKGAGVVEILPHVWPMLLFTAVVLLLGIRTYKKTLD